MQIFKLIGSYTTARSRFSCSIRRNANKNNKHACCDPCFTKEKTKKKTIEKQKIPTRK